MATKQPAKCLKVMTQILPWKWNPITREALGQDTNLGDDFATTTWISALLVPALLPRGAQVVPVVAQNWSFNRARSGDRPWFG